MPTDWLSQTARKIGDAFGARRETPTGISVSSYVLIQR